MTLRVVHTTYAWGRLTEGWLRAVVAEFEGGDVRVVAARRADEEAQPARESAGIPVRLVGDGPTGPLFRELDRAWAKLTGRRLAAAYRRLVPDRRADIVHAHFGDWGYAIAPLASRLGARLVVSFYGYDAGSLPRRPGWAGRLNDLFSTAARIVVEGPAMAARLVDLGCPRDRIAIVPLGVDVEAWAATAPGHARSVEDFRLLVVGSLREKKGVDDALRAVARAADRLASGWRLDIIGDGPLGGSLRALAAELGIADRVHWHGYVPEHDLAGWLGAADVLIQASRTAADGDTEGGAPVVLMLAAATGLPVVASRHADIPFIVEDGLSGLLADERDVATLADHLVTLAEPGLRGRLSAGARTIARERFSVERSRRQLADLYAAVAAVATPQGHGSAS